MYVDTEVQARQQLNCEHALAQARSEGVRFLLHVDSDELLYVPFELPQKEGRDVQSASQAAVCQDPFPTAGPPWRSVLFEARAALRGHLAHLESLHALQFTYVNLEAVPEVEDSSDPFTSVTLFKTHPSQLKVTTMAARRALSHWTEAPASGGQFFRFYTNGKSLVRVDDEITTVSFVNEHNTVFTCKLSVAIQTPPCNGCCTSRHLVTSKVRLVSCFVGGLCSRMDAPKCSA